MIKQKSNHELSAMLCVSLVTRGNRLIKKGKLSEPSEKLKNYIKNFVKGNLLFSENTYSFEESFSYFERLMYELERNGSEVVRVTSSDVIHARAALSKKTSRSRFLLREGSISYKIPFWEVIAALWIAGIVDISFERKSDLKGKDEVVLKRNKKVKLSINTVRSAFGLPLIDEYKHKTLPPDQRKIWYSYEKRELHFKTASLEDNATVDFSTARKTYKLFEVLYELWSNDLSAEKFYTRAKITQAYKKKYNFSNEEVFELIGGIKLGKDANNIKLLFAKKNLSPQLKLVFKRITNDEEKNGYTFDLIPLV